MIEKNFKKLYFFTNVQRIGKKTGTIFGFFFPRLKALSEYATINLNQKKNNKTSLSFAFSTNFEFPKHLNSKISLILPVS